MSRIENADKLENTRTNAEIIQLLLDYYNNARLEDGTYVVFDAEIEDQGNELRVLVRYQWSDEEINEYEEAGVFPGTNILVSSVTINKITGEAVDDNDKIWGLW